MLERSTVASAVRRVQDEIAIWQASDSPFVQWRGRTRKAISDLLIQAFHGLFDLVGTDDVANDAKNIILKIDAMEDALADWAQACDLTPEDADPKGSTALWAAWTEVLDALKQQRPRKPEDIATLVEQKVSDRQIALIYGWRDEAGEPDLAKVREEKAKPGTHYDPTQWVHPAEVKIQAAIDQAWAERQQRIDDKVVSRHMPMVAPESIEELIQQRVPSKQIAKMKRVDIEEVRAVAARIGVPLDGQFVRRVSAVDRLADIRDEETQREASLEHQMARQTPSGDSETSGLEDRVLDLYLDGQSPQEIAAALASEFPNLTYQKVGRIIKTAE